MSKEDSKILKGVAILLMVFYHCFCVLGNSEECENLLRISGLPLTFILTRACNPVSFFLILSGYGLYIVENKNNNYNILTKIRNLYIHYWISLLIFVTLCAYFIGTTRYPGSLRDIIFNITAWNTTWNGEIWFFLPYILLALSSRWLFHLMDRTNIWLFMGVTLFISTASAYCISKYGDAYFYHNQLPYMPILYMNCLFSFTVGAWMAKYNIVGKFRDKCITSGYRCWSLLILLVAIRCCVDTSAFHSFYAIAFIILFVNAPRWNCVNNFLTKMGKRSTSIWFVHTYFCYYLFHDFIYSFKYPVVIFLVLLICSYLSAVVIDWINARVLKVI